MLRTLEHEVPPQVRKTDQSCRVLIRDRGLGYTVNWHPDASQHFWFYLLLLETQWMNGAAAIPVPQH